MVTTVGQVIVNEALPPRFRDYGRIMDSKGIEEVLESVARDAPEEYAGVTKRLMDIGNDAAFDTGTTIRMSDLRPAYDKRPLLKALDIAEDRIRGDRSLTEAQKSEMVEKLYDRANSRLMDETYGAELARRNQLALQVASKARGNKTQLAAFISSPGTYSTPSGKMVPMFIRHSFAEGLTPAEYWAGSFGARTGVVSTKTATAKGGAFGKLLSASAISQVITSDDCETAAGLPVRLDDDDNIGAVLARPAGSYDAGTVITKSVLSDLRKDKGLDEIVVRSPVTCGCKDGICSKCAGIRETGGFPPIGYNLGTNAASAFAERITQGALNCLAEGTLVRMADGSVRPIERVRPGDMVLGCDLNGYVSPTPVVNWYDNGIQPCVRTEFKENGAQGGGTIALESTVIHKMLCTRVVSGQKDEVHNWKPRILPVGTKSRHFYAYTVSSFDDTGLHDERLAMLIGTLLGDGCYTKSVGGVHLSCADDTEIKDLRKSISGLNIGITKLKFHNGIYYRISMLDRASPDKLGNPVKNYLIKHGMYGKLAHEKTVPDVVHSWSNRSIGDLIGGLIASDGSVYDSDNKGKPGVSFTSTSRKLVEQVKELLTLRFGIIGSKVTRTGRAGKWCRKHDQYQFTITKPQEVEKFASVVNIPGIKATRLRNLLRDYHPGKLHERTAFRRVSQVEIGPKHVYDIEIGTPDHIFLLANGLVVSNTKHCLVENTLVRMADFSVKPIEEIEVGDLVLGSDIYGRIAPVRVVETFDNGFEPCVRTVFRKIRGRSSGGDIVLESTSNHKVLAAKSNATIALGGSDRSPIKVGSKARIFVAEAPTSFDDTGFIDEPLAKILGVLVGDGCYTRSVNGVYISCSDQSEVDDLNAYLAKMSLKLQKLKYHDGIYYRVSSVGADHPDRLGNPVKNYLIKSGMYGKFAHTKDIPQEIYSWNNKSVAEFIGGFIAADGSVCESSNGGGIIAIASTSIVLIQHIQELLQVRFGIQSSAITRTGRVGSPINAVKDKHGVYCRKHDQHQFTISQASMLKRVLDNIPIPGNKQNKLRAIVDKMDASGKKAPYRRGYARISQEEIGIRHVYDIHVANKDHLFLLANGLIVSNSGKAMKGKGSYQGFNMFTSLAKVPKVFPDRATISSMDGTVSKIEDAPQGGTYIYVTDSHGSSSRHYVAPGYGIEVKVGDELEAGDQMSDGVIDPSELVKYKGIGEARRYWANRFTQAIRDSGMAANRRNAEVLARTVMNTVRLNSEDEAGEGLPGDVVTYTRWSNGFKPRANSALVAPTASAVGKYLEQPVLHYTIGTRVTPSVLRTLKKFKVDRMMVNDTEPDVTPFMERIEDSNAEKPDWMARLGTTYLKSRLQDDVARGAESHLHSTEPYPGIAKGVEFGDWGQPLSKNRSEHFTY